MLLTACEAPPTGIRAKLVTFAELPGWQQSDLGKSLGAWRRSCERIMTMDPATLLGGQVAAGSAADWQPICSALPELSSKPGDVRAFIEANFAAYAIRDGKEHEGLFTGYFEPIVRASETSNGAYKVPIHALPGDHVTVYLKDFDAELSGRTIVGRLDGQRLRPYPDRGEISNNAGSADENILYWADDELDVFILQVQGSGIVELPDGRRQRIGFAGHNGHDYASIGRRLIEQDELRNAGWEDIRDWMDKNPDKVKQLFAHNRRYIFFRNIDGAAAQGAAGVQLTAGYSLAVDPEFLPLNVPLWLDTVHPGPGAARLQRLVFAQDVGNAIRGPVRGDLFWGIGPEALAFAGRMKSPGTYYLLVPKGVSPTS